jgi:CheY-like chemotaxis protein
MTNDAISAMLEHLCNEARNSMHATFGVLDLLRDVVTDPLQRASLTIGRSSADRLLRSIDDARDLVSSVPPPPASRDEFDFAMCVGEMIEVLNLAAAKRRRHMLFDSPLTAVPIIQDRKSVEQVLTRVLDAAFKLNPANDVNLRLSPRHGDKGACLAIHVRDAALAIRLVDWLNANPARAVFEDPADVPFQVAVMVAGKHLRELGGSADLERDAAGHSVVALDLPSQARSISAGDYMDSGAEVPPPALNVLVAEDCDDNFAVSEVMLPHENLSRARDGREALHMLQKQRFDVALLDVHMPEMNGYAVIHGIRVWEAETGNAPTPLVILSSDDLETQQRSAAHCGCTGFVRKPLRRSDLINLLDRLKAARVAVPEAIPVG